MTAYTGDVLDRLSRPIPGVEVYIYALDAVTLATITPSNPLITDADGLFTFDATEGFYVAQYDLAGTTVRKDVVLVGQTPIEQAEAARDDILGDAGFQAVAADLTGANTIGQVATVPGAVAAITAGATLAGHYANDSTNVAVPGQGDPTARGAKYWSLQTAADVLLTHADVTTTGTNVTQTHADVTSTAANLASVLAAVAAGTLTTFGSTADALSTGVVGYTTTAAGSGGTNGTYSLTLSGGGGTGAAARVLISGGAIATDGIKRLSKGKNYTSAPTVAFTGITGLTGAAVTAVIGANTVDGDYFGVPNVVSGGVDLYTNSAGSAVYLMNLADNLAPTKVSDKIGGSQVYSSAITTGWPAITGSSAPTATTWANNIALSTGYLASVPLYIATVGNGTGKLVFFSFVSGTTWKQELVVNVTGATAGAVTLLAGTHFASNSHVSAGWVVGWYAAAGGAQVAFNAVAGTAGFSVAGAPVQGNNVTLTATTGNKFSMQAVVNTIPYVIEPHLTAAEANIAALQSAVTDQRQTFGYPYGTIPDGTSTASAGYFGFYAPALGDGTTYQLRVYAAAAGTVTLQRFTMTGGVTTFVGSGVAVAVPAAGSNVIAVSMPFLEGEYIAWTGTGVVRFVTGATSTGERGDDAGTIAIVGNGSAIPAAPTQTFHMHIGLDATFHAKRARAQRHVITVQSSDKIVFKRNSYASETYALRGKSYYQQAADLTEWRVENFSVAGQSVLSDIQDIQTNAQTYSYLGLRDVNPTWLFAGELTNSALAYTVAQYVDLTRQLIETAKSLGCGLILGTEHVKNYTAGGIELGPELVKKLADEYGTAFLSYRQNANIFSPANGGYGSDYAGWTVGGHLNTRYNTILSQPLRDFIATKLGRPRTSLRIWRPRPNADGTAPTIASADALLFDPDKLVDRKLLFREIDHGQAALADANEKYVDEINNAAVTAPGQAIPSEYLALQLGKTVAFTDYAYIEAILGGNGRDVEGHGIYVSDATATVYVRDALYRDSANTGYPASTAPTGRWRQVQIDTDGFARLSGRSTVGTVFGDKVCWLIAKAGAFTLSEPRVEWFGSHGKVAPPLPSSARPLGAEQITSPYLANGGALQSGWTATGTPTFGTGLPAESVTNKMLPRGATGHVILSTANKANVTLAWAADDYRDRELEIAIWTSSLKAIVDSTASYPSAASITRYTYDLDRLLVEIIGSTNTVPLYMDAHLYWSEQRVRTLVPAGATGFSLRLSALANTVGVAKCSAKFVEA